MTSACRALRQKAVLHSERHTVARLSCAFRRFWPTRPWRKKMAKMLVAQQNLRAAFAASDSSRAQLLTDAGASGFNIHHATPELLASAMRYTSCWQESANVRTACWMQLCRIRRNWHRSSKDIALLRAEATLLESRIAKTQEPPGVTTSLDAGVLVDTAPRNGRLAEYFLGNEHSWLFEIRDGVVAVHRLPDHIELAALARQLHVAWRSLETAKGNRSAISHQLAASVFGPLTAPMPAETLLIVPDGALHLVPMALLARQSWPEMHTGFSIRHPLPFRIECLAACPGPGHWEVACRGCRPDLCAERFAHSNCCEASSHHSRRAIDAERSRLELAPAPACHGNRGPRPDCPRQ